MVCVIGVTGVAVVVGVVGEGRHPAIGLLLSGPRLGLNPCASHSPSAARHATGFLRDKGSWHCAGAALPWRSTRTTLAKSGHASTALTPLVLDSCCIGTAPVLRWYYTGTAQRHWTCGVPVVLHWLCSIARAKHWYCTCTALVLGRPRPLDLPPFLWYV